MSKTIISLRIAGIVMFLLFMLLKLLGYKYQTSFYFTDIPQIFLLVTFLIFAFLILIQLYNALVNTIVDKPDKKDQ